MFCPKCKAKIGLYRYEARTQYHVTEGMTCTVCGYWLEGGLESSKGRRKRKR